MEWDRPEYSQPRLTVLATDLRTSTEFLGCCGTDEVRISFHEFSSLTADIVNEIGLQTGEPYRISSFVGDGFLTFFGESPVDALYRTGPARALIAAKRLQREFRVLREHRFGRFNNIARLRLRRLKLACGISFGDVFYGPFGSPAVAGNTGMLETVVEAFRLTKLKVAEPEELNDYIVCSRAAWREIVNVQGRGESGLSEVEYAAEEAPERERLVRELDGLTFAERHEELQGLGIVRFREPIWLEPQASPEVGAT